ncbi:MAG: hypothetical protein ABEK42_09910 [Thiohalorhabdaceae bacterium]
MPPRTAFAFGLAAGLSLVYFLGLLQGLGLGLLLAVPGRCRRPGVRGLLCGAGVHAGRSVRGAAAF